MLLQQAVAQRHAVVRLRGRRVAMRDRRVVQLYCLFQLHRLQGILSTFKERNGLREIALFWRRHVLRKCQVLPNLIDMLRV